MARPWSHMLSASSWSFVGQRLLQQVWFRGAKNVELLLCKLSTWTVRENGMVCGGGEVPNQVFVRSQCLPSRRFSIRIVFNLFNSNIHQPTFPKTSRYPTWSRLPMAEFIRLAQALTELGFATLKLSDTCRVTACCAPAWAFP